MEYYDATERYLLNYGIDIRERPYVVQGAVFSYSIQHGQLTAAQAVVAAGINNSTSDEDFLKSCTDTASRSSPPILPDIRQKGSMR